MATKNEVTLDDLKLMVKESYEYFESNYDSFHAFRRFLYKSTLNNDQKTSLIELSREPLEFNSVEALISKLYGDFAKQEPTLQVNSSPDVGIVDPKLISVAEGHSQAFMTTGKAKNAQTTALAHSVSGGYFVFKVYTDYAGDHTFEQNIFFETISDPTLCGFDPLAFEKTKCDGNYCFQLYPKLKQDVEHQYGIKLDNLSFTRQMEGFTWSYRVDNRVDIVLIAELYLKKSKKVKLVRAADNKTYTEDEYEEMLLEHQMSGNLAQPPVILESRITNVTEICCYRFIEDRILEYKETDYDYLPLVFGDGNSVLLRDDANGNSVQQFTRPLIYHAMAAQKLKNVAGQVLAKEIDMTAPAKFMIDALSVPERYLENWQNPQLANALIYQSTSDNSSTPLPPPQAVPRVPLPPEILQTFSTIDQMIQTILGVYPNPMSQMSGTVSGRAIELADAGNTGASMPYLVNYLEALNQVAVIFLNLMPKYYVTPRSIPIVNKDGKREFVRINDPQKEGSPMLNELTPDALDITVTPGVNFEVEKQRSFNTMIQLIQVLPAFGMFLQQKGLGVVLDNLSIRGVDALKSLYEDYQEEMEQAKQQAQQGGQQMPPNPEIIKAQTAQQKMQQEDRFRAVEAALKEKEIQVEQMKAILQSQTEYQNHVLQFAKANQDMSEREERLAMDKVDQSHRHAQDIIENEINNKPETQPQGAQQNEGQP